jgi:sec-independent protein translocase protein TatB
MFGIGWAELLVIAVVATVIVPPRDLPRLMRGFGHSVRKLRHVADDLQRQFEQAMQEGKIEGRTPNDPPLLPIPADPAEPRSASKPASRPRPSRATVGQTAAPRGRTSKSIRRKQRRTIAAK